MWVKLKENGNFRNLYGKQNAGADFQANFSGTIGIEVYRDRSTISYATNDTAFKIGHWQFFVSTYDGTDGVRLYLGDEYRPPVELSYDARQVGSGSEANVSSWDFMICQDNTLSNNAAPVLVSSVSFYTRRMTLGEVQKIWKNPNAPSPLLHSLYGHNAKWQHDFSGNGFHGEAVGPIMSSDGPRIHQRKRYLPAIETTPQGGILRRILRPFKNIQIPIKRLNL
jgi:hypothetical protein